MIDGVQLRVSMARRQPSFEQPTDASTTSWAQIGKTLENKPNMKLVQIAVIVDPEEVVHFCDSNWLLISCWADRENFSVINPMGFSLHFVFTKATHDHDVSLWRACGSTGEKKSTV